jgi:hypothetical protein
MLKPTALGDDLVYEADPDGRPVIHRRKLDTIATLRRNGSISDDMHDAARRFETAFHVAGVGCRGSTWAFDRVQGGSGSSGETERVTAARVYITDCAAVLGGMGTMQLSAVWHVCGNQISIREWRERAAWNGFRLRDDRHAAGVLIASLQILASR